MPEHEIRFRAGWTLLELDEAGATTKRVLTLPVDWSSLQPRGRFVRILRSFQRPPIDPDTESIGLRMADAPGVVALRLNDRPILFERDAFRIGHECPMAPLDARRNALELEIDLDEATTARTWGRVSLIIHSKFESDNNERGKATGDFLGRLGGG